MSSNVETVYFVDGCVIDRDYIYLASKLHSIDANEYDYTRMCYEYRGDWFYHDLNWDVISVCVLGAQGDVPRQSCAMSIQGDIEFQYPGTIYEEKIPEAGTFEGLGALKQLRQIGDHLYACGDQGQVYKREAADQWAHMDDGLLDREISVSALDLNSLDGLADDDIYMVGFHGRIYHFDGQSWTEVESGTNAHLHRVKVDTNGVVHVCGKKGVYLRGDKDGFTDHSMPGMDNSFWDLEPFGDNVYLASLDGLFVFDGEAIAPLATGLDPEIGGYRLDSGDGVMWSFGVDDLACFDGEEWTRLEHPDNVDI